MSDLRQFRRAVIEAFVPALRDKLHGRTIDEDEIREELEYQLRNRGFAIEESDDE